MKKFSYEGQQVARVVGVASSLIVSPFTVTQPAGHNHPGEYVNM